MKRYDCDTEYNHGVMTEDPDGDYVKLDDVVEMIKKIKDPNGACECEDSSLRGMEIEHFLSFIAKETTDEKITV